MNTVPIKSIDTAIAHFKRKMDGDEYKTVYASEVLQILNFIKQESDKIVTGIGYCPSDDPNEISYSGGFYAVNQEES